MPRRKHRSRHYLSFAVLRLAALVLALSWTAAWVPLADYVNIAAAWWWPVLLAAVAIACWRLRHRLALWPGIAVFVAALATGLVLFHPLLKQGPSMGRSTQPVSMIEFNMLKSNPNAREDAAWLAAHDADILVLLEASRMQKEWGAVLQAKYPTMVSCSEHYSCSTVLFSRFPLVRHEAHAGDGDADNRKALSALTAVLDVNGTELTVIAAHLDRPWPLGEQSRWIEPMRKVAAQATGPAVMAGDFNTAPWTHAMRTISGAGEFRLGSGLVTSWPKENAALLRLPIDQLYLRGRVQATSVETGPRRSSDHLPLMIYLEIPDGKDNRD
ncbi:endonuclease/exonuclease/phosphatase family protein [Croceicoccus marinus]|uniref:Endonuclease/exonuclease/phosphatase domain-containing protein n=1 Tax=Croceicoccus marinus TaxID=450378 RepID=A0A1Z1FDC4_9SPHN|nr:endonuclease/exonuclease/phosphatase family protein [Croceicoccus marinus]ARU16713.1 hypothetical protein A9D14_11640 [Croceicoccus marinus]